jgi:phosphohistidine phosphatase
MRLYLARHGDYINAADDFGRVLSERGRREIQAVANALSKKNVTLSNTLHSGKMRAQQSAEIFADTLMPSSIISMVEGLRPEDDPTTFEAAQFASIEDGTMIVGHLPFMGRMVSHLLTGDADRDPHVFEAGTVVCLERGENGKWSKSWALHPSSL